MRILWWSNVIDPPAGGAEVWAGWMIAHLRSEGHELRVVSPDTVSSEFDMPQQLSALRDMLGQFAPELVVVNEFVPSTLALFNLLGSAITAPRVLVVHAQWPQASMVPGSPFRTLLARIDHVLCFSPEVADWISSFRKDVPVTRIDLTSEPLAEPVVPLPAKAHLLFCGRLSKEKGISVLLTALDLLSSKNLDLTISIAGDGPLRSEVLEHGDAAMRFLGRVPHDRVGALIDAASMVCVPSLQESFGLVALEAAWRGRPVVASDTGGLARIVRDGETGLLVEPGNVAQLAGAISRLAKDREGAQAMGSAARALAEAWPDWEAHLREASSTIISVASEEGRSAHPALD